ncbi:ATP-binding protein [Mesobacillus zeae]|uniref:histidine kinase n=1 Tax=Mesobacillus zeae TaxID=1917180 RepID=A0A398B4B6_9BACI|nr:ATP-binding protein [Mesobacillus zeae]RID84682.1 response regulator [Mesobacillus zeae]
MIRKFIKKSLARQFLFLMGCFMFVFLCLAGILLATLDQLNESYIERNHVLEQKETLAAGIDKNFSQVFLNIRGYIAFGNPELKSEALALEPEIREQIRQFKVIATEKEDKGFADETEEFIDYYFIHTLPGVIENYENKNMTAVVDKANNEATERLSGFQKTLDRYLASNDEELSQSFNSLTKMETFIQVGFVIFLLVSLLVLQRVIRIMLSQVGQPLAELAAAANETAMGREAAIQATNGREDEIGILSTSFHRMLASIQEKENDLVAHNEELFAQQEELQAQQAELEETLRTLKESQLALKGRNQLIHHISNTFDKQKVLQSAVIHMAQVIQADSGIISLVGEGSYAAYSLSKEGIEQFQENFRQRGFMARLETEQRPFLVKREAGAKENGVHLVHDVYIPIYLTGGGLYAVMVFSRFSGSFEERQLEEYAALAKNIGNSLDKVSLYQKTEEERQLNQEIINSVQEGLQLISTTGRMLQINRALCEAFSCEDKLPQIPGCSWGQWTSYIRKRIEDGDSFIEYLEKVLNGGSSEQSFIYRMLDSRQIYKVYSEELYRGKEKYGIILVHRNITREYEVNQMKSEFVSTVSHELRTPLASIFGFTELLLHRDLKPERQKKYVKTIYKETQRLTSLINDFLDVQKMESGKQNYEKRYFDVLPLIEKIISLQRVNAPSHRIALESQDGEGIIYGDKRKLEQAFSNIISNAIKYSPGGGQIDLNAKRDGDKLVVSIKDEGLGIPEESIDRLFNKFYRVDNSDRRKIGGTGLGLSIVQEIVKAHYGEVTVESQYRKGSTFTVSLPSVPGHETVREEGTGQGHRILVVEDDQSLAELMVDELKDSGFRVSWYRTGSEAMVAIGNDAPDAIVLDIVLEDGESDGWELLKVLKSQEGTKHLPIVISTALDEKERGFSLGANDYLIKPYQASELSKAILQTLLKIGKQGQILIRDK